MGSCTRRHFLLSTCFLQMITIIERQVFDFLGYMWAPILVNFFHILFIIFGFYGAYHFRIKYIITYLIWNFLWIGWNSFLICFYLNVGTLDRDSDLLNLGTGSVSWFEVNGYGCKPIYNTNITSEDPYRPLRPESVEDCLLTYDIVEVVHSGVQCILAFFGILGAILISYIFLDEDDRFDFMNGDAKSPQHTVVHPMYVSYTSIPTSASGTMLSNKHQNHTLNHHQHHLHHPNHQQNTLSNSNNHLNNSTHAISTTTTPITTTTTSTTNNHHHNNNNNNSCNTPLATKKKFSSSSLANSIQQQQQTSLHKQILTANATTATNNYNNNINNSNSISHSHSNSNRNSSNSNQHNSNNNNISNSNTFLIHSHNSNSRSRGAAADISSYNGSLLSNTSQYQPYNSGGSRRNRQHRNMSPSLSTASNSLTHMLYSPKQGRKVQPSSSNSIFPANIDLAQKQPIIPAYYDDSTAKADHQLYVNGSRRQILIAQSPNQDTTPSLSYASLQNSTQNLNSSFKQNATPSNALSSSLSNSNYSLTNSLNNNQMAAVSGASGSGTSGHFARIHSKPKPAKSSSYSSFKHSASASNQPPDLKYNQIFNENSARSNTSPDQQQPEFEECFEEDDFSVQNLKTDEGVTYIPFTKPTPGNYFLTPPPPPSTQSGNNNKPNPTLSTLSSQNSLNNNSHQQQQFPPASISPNNNTSVPHMYHDNSGILLEHGAILQPLTPHELSPAQRALMYQQNGLPFHPAYSPVPYRQNSACTAQKPTPRPTNIPLPKVPDTYQAEFLSPSEVTPPPPPLPRPHIFQPRTGTAPYPDLSPEVTERYAMPTQYIPRSPVATRIARRQRQQNASNERSHGPSANYCDQIRDTTNGYGPDSTSANTYTISKARSYDRLTSSQSVNGSFKDSKRNKTKTEELTSPPPNSPLTKDMAPHVNRRSGRRDGQKARPRSYCNSMSGGEGVIRGNIALDRKVGYAN